MAKTTITICFLIIAIWYMFHCSGSLLSRDVISGELKVADRRMLSKVNWKNGAVDNNKNNSLATNFDDQSINVYDIVEVPVLSNTKQEVWFCRLIHITIIAIITVLSTNNQSESSILKSVELLQVTLDSINVGVISTDTRMIITFMNTTAGKMCGWLPSRVIGRRLGDVVRLVEKGDCGEAVDTEDVGVVLQSRGGRLLDVRKSVAPLTANGQVIGLAVMLQDRTAERDLLRKLSYCATHDALTGLPNRACFDKRLRSALDECAEFTAQHALVVLDLDGFKHINDTCGHAAGDALLINLSKLMKNQLRCGDCIARLGGDEFAIILFDCPLEQAKNLMEQLVVRISEYKFSWEGKNSFVGASVGVTGLSATSGSVSELMARADDACYTAKRLGKKQVCVYELNHN